MTHDLSIIAISVAGTLGAQVIALAAWLLHNDHQTDKALGEREAYKARSRAFYARLRGA